VALGLSLLQLCAIKQIYTAAEYEHLNDAVKKQMAMHRSDRAAKGLCPAGLFVTQSNNLESQGHASQGDKAFP